MKKSQIVGAVSAALILAGMFFIPESIGLGQSGIRTLGLLIAIIVLLVTEPIPIGVTCITGVALMVILGIYPNIAGALNGYTHHILFFVLVSFGISEAISHVPLSKRLLVFLVRLFGAKSEMVLLAVMLSAAIMSSIMSNVATTAVLVSVIMNFLKIYTVKEDYDRSAKAFMIGLPIASMIGGIMTPAGSPLNMLGMDYLQSEAGITISFLQWMIIGIPSALIMLAAAWWLTCHIFKPAPISNESVDQYFESLQIPAKFDLHEKYVSLVIFCMFTLWILSSWFPVLNITLVGTIGFAFLFIPKFGVLNWNDFSASVSWASYFLIGTMMSFGNALNIHGVSEWLVKSLFSGEMALPLPFIILIISVSVFLLLIPIPIGPALISMLGSPFVGLAVSWGISPAALILPLTFCASNCYLLPLDTVPLLTYATGSYKMSDMPKVSIFLQILLSVCLALWLPIALRILGL